jgi:choline dehydrogenase-like flavoprotein
MGKEALERFAPQYRHSQAVIALLRDGFHEQSPGGTVLLRDDGSPVLDYPLGEYLWEGFFTAYERIAEVQFAAGARQVQPLHMDAPPYRSWAEAQAGLRTLPRRPIGAGLFSAHLMGGCAMGEDPRQAVVDSNGQHHQVPGLSVIDGSIFPTSLGVNPQMSIYGIAARLAARLAGTLGGKVAAA